MILRRNATVADLMTRNVQAVHPETTIQEAARRMKELDCGALPVIDPDRKVIGMITDRDITVRAIAGGKDPKATRVSEVMTHDVISCHSGTSLRECEEMMRKHQIRRLPVLDQNRSLVGILTIGKLAQEENERTAGRVLKEVSEKVHRDPGFAETQKS